ncbi:site-specific DNA-methyltransferase [Clostridium neonatale]|uniref:site-specific DNA-methyltransferase n=1 Tax=Clostridium neonatale TaxID=137838 RepID=UPI00291C3FCD|nr:adenine-specific DNA-methyltransferase [Clostridium neonatale]
MNNKAQKFINLLKEIFEVDKSDLDFGIYKIINYKRDAINEFLEKDLVNQVSKELEQFNGDKEVVEEKIYSHLINFFSRYYEEGDFISKRRYKDGAYAIPYQGEEVKLYWANSDQYYIKSSENFKDYSFKAGDKKIHFKLVEADTEINNNKTLEGNKYFVLSEQEDVVSIKGDELIIKFEFKSLPKNRQDKINEETIKKILVELNKSSDYRDYLIQLQQIRPTDKNKNRTLLEKELASYTSKNSFDFFIHKNLDKFLKNELDFYIKNEILNLDNIENSNGKNLEEQLEEVKFIKSISEKIIEFLNQIENFQKRLWLKKKFVVSTNYCITLDKIPEKYYTEIASNKEQIIEWKKLYKIEDIIDVDYLKENQYLLVDTKFFKQEFIDNILSEFDNLDKELNGLLIHSDNFHALNLLKSKYKDSIKCCYIDPPYNTDASKIAYKNGYEHSSWITLMNDRLQLVKNLLKEDGIIQVAIDDYEFRYLNMLLENIFGINNFISNVAILTNPKGRDQEFIAQSHDYSIIYAKDRKNAKTNYFELTDAELNRKYSLVKGGEAYRELPLKRTGSEKFREDRPYMFFPFIYYKESKKLELISKEEHLKIYNKELGEFDDKYLNKLKIKYTNNGAEFILPKDELGNYLRWRWGYDSCKSGIENEVIFAKITQKNTINIYEKNMEDRYYTPKSFWIGEKYDASSKGTNILKNIIQDNIFDYPKSLYTVIDNLTIGADNDSLVIDFFAGSATTGHAIIEMNRKDLGNRKYILVEMGNYFNTVTKPRIEKVVYSREWKNGYPIDKEGISHMFKYIELEQYEDSLNNIEFIDKKQLEFLNNVDENVKEEYLLSYMLDFETKNSSAFLNVDMLMNPFDYKLKIERNGETQYRNIDIIETFNYLIGLNVEAISKREAYVYDGKNIDRYFEGTYVFKRIEGKLNDGSKVLIVWRNISDDLKTNNDVLNKYIEKKSIDTNEYDYIYINGDNTIEIDGRDNYKIKLIEDEFKTLMFEDVE